MYTVWLKTNVFSAVCYVNLFEYIIYSHSIHIYIYIRNDTHIMCVLLRIKDAKIDNLQQKLAGGSNMSMNMMAN